MERTTKERRRRYIGDRTRIRKTYDSEETGEDEATWTADRTRNRMRKRTTTEVADRTRNRMPKRTEAAGKTWWWQTRHRTSLGDPDSLLASARNPYTGFAARGESLGVLEPTAYLPTFEQAKAGDF